MLSRSISSDIVRAAVIDLRAAALMAMTFGMTGSQFAVSECGASLRGLLVSLRFGMSAPKGKNGFVEGRIVSSQAPRRNIRGRNASNFNRRKMGDFGRKNSSA